MNSPSLFLSFFFGCRKNEEQKKFYRPAIKTERSYINAFLGHN